MSSTVSDASASVRPQPTMAGWDGGCDDLMLMIRHDLGEPLQHLRQALSITRAGADAHGTQAVLDEVESLARVLDKLVDVASLWSGVHPAQACDRIELWPLLQEVWGEVEPLALARSVRVRFHVQPGDSSLATLYGNHAWLRRMFQECMEAAVRGTSPGDSLDIEHHQAGPRALIVFRDSGVFSRPSGICLEATSEDSPTEQLRQRLRAARDRIGQRLVRQIVSQHGGQLHEEADGSQRDFLIELPTGAPFRTDTSDLDAAQAAHFARDLAALVARARDRRAAADMTGSPNGPRG